jgi:hypothetical protein
LIHPFDFAICFDKSLILFVRPKTNYFMKKIYTLLGGAMLFFNSIYAQWALTGNAITAGNFLGTTNSVNLLFKANSTNAGVIDVLYKNTGFGLNTFSPLSTNTAPVENSAFGYYALQDLDSGIANTAVGFYSLRQTTNGTNNTGVGEETLYSNTTGYGNNAFGGLALYYNTSGNFNSAYGLTALIGNTTGSHNVAIGDSTSNINTTGSYTTAVGDFAGPSSSNLTNASAFGYQATVNASNKVVIGNTSVTSIGGYAAWTNFSDGRFKKNIQENVPGLSFIKLLRPVTYTLNISGVNSLNLRAKKLPASSIDQASVSQKEKIVYTGFIAQEVEVSAKKINYDFSGVVAPQNENDFYGLRYSDFVVPMVKAIQEVSATNDNLQTEVDSLKSVTAGLVSQVNALLAQVNALKSTSLSDAPVINQNVPNPFNNTTTISYYIPGKTNNAQLTITDAQGNALKEVVLGNSKGPGQAVINVGGLASGTYFYSLVVNGKVIDTKKMVLTR